MSDTQLKINIRRMIRRDMTEVLEIERTSFEFSWFEEDFVRCLRQRTNIGMVAEKNAKVIGFMVYELHKTRLHILNFAVHPKFRRRGVAQSLADKLVSKLCKERRTHITLEVRETNVAAQLFFKQARFKATTVLQGYYDDSDEDAYLMCYQRKDNPQSLTPGITQ